MEEDERRGRRKSKETGNVKGKEETKEGGG